MDLRNRGVLITGASRGLGASLALDLGRRGARLALVARGKDALDRVVAEVRSSGGEAHAIAADVGDKAAAYAIAGSAAAAVGAIDVVVHNASRLGPTPLRLLGDTACEDLQAVFDVNVVGPFRLTKALVGPMALCGRGLVVSLSSDAAVSAYPRWGAYGASKAAADHLSRIWAAELDGTGVRFVSVDPGDMDTEMHASALPEADRATLARPEDVAARIAEILEDETLANGTRIEVAARRRAS
jgi:NAD(P)-dependent dehydrogenase (short-subunit alcohol dehydrogenase family)